MSQLIYVSFAKRIYQSASPADLIVAASVVQVRIRAGTLTCDPGALGPGVDVTPLGCDAEASLAENSTRVLAQQAVAPCVGAIVPLIVDAVKDGGRGFTFDRTVADQDYRAEDIDMVMPDHDGLACGESLSSSSSGS